MEERREERKGCKGEEEKGRDGGDEKEFAGSMSNCFLSPCRLGN